MNQPKNDTYQRFWFGFALGAAICGVGMAAVGTKQGRSALRKTMEYLEDVEDTPEQVHKIIDAIQEITGPLLVMTKEAVSFEEKLKTAAKEPEAPLKSKVTSSTKTPEVSKNAQNSETLIDKIEDTAQDLSEVIDRMRSITSSEKSDQKFFKVNKK